MRLTRRGKIVFGSLAALIFIFNPVTQSEAIAPMKPKEVAHLWTADRAKLHAKSRLADWGWRPNEFACLNVLWTKESNWRKEARNKVAVTQVRDGKRVRLHAGGIPQILGLNPALTVPEQIRLGLTYIDSRYGSPCRAWKFWRAHGYY